MHWSEALAKSFLAEAQAFGEEIFFRGVTFTGLAGSSDSTRALEVAGYMEHESITLLIPDKSLIDIETAPEPNEVLELRERAYRIDKVRVADGNSGYELQLEFIPDYRLERQSIIYGRQQPQSPSSVLVNIL